MHSRPYVLLTRFLQRKWHYWRYTEYVQTYVRLDGINMCSGYCIRAVRFCGGKAVEAGSHSPLHTRGWHRVDSTDNHSFGCTVGRRFSASENGSSLVMNAFCTRVDNVNLRLAINVNCKGYPKVMSIRKACRRSQVALIVVNQPECRRSMRLATQATQATHRLQHT
jgi:hypothetical protein